MAVNRLVGDYPVIGIRPTIDGRRGFLKVRESLEEQTMNMAKAAAALFTENLRYSNGEPVQVPQGGSGYHADRDALLVLRRGDYGHGA